LSKKPQKHHYETSKEANLNSFAASLVIFTLIMFYFINIRGQPFDLAFSNRAFAIGAVFLIGLSYFLGPLAGISKSIARKLQYRKPLGLYGYSFATIHILLSFLVVPADVLGANGLSLFFGMIAIIIFSFVAMSSMMNEESINAFGFERWQRIQRMGYLAFFLVILHFVILENGQFIGRQVGQLTLVFASLVILARIITVFSKKRR